LTWQKWQKWQPYLGKVKIMPLMPVQIYIQAAWHAGQWTKERAALKYSERKLVFFEKKIQAIEKRYKW